MIRNVLIWCIFFISLSSSSDITSKWHYECTEGYCLKQLITTNTSSPLSLAECNILCLDSAAVWPKPTGAIAVANLTQIDIENFSFTTEKGTAISSSVNSAFNIFTDQIKKFVPCKCLLKSGVDGLYSVHINFEIVDQNTSTLTFGTNESYTIESSEVTGSTVNISITAETYFGARHALETLTQLVVYDDLRDRILFPTTISVSDGPVYGWRGINLDTARNFITPAAIKRTLRAMAASKLNTFHWHLTDSSSFPYVSKSRPELSQYGAYSPTKVYTDRIIRDIVEYARIRGIRVVPELDTPAHVGEGWQETGVLTCFNWKPWASYCSEPPCGQLDPSKDEVYDILEDLYGDLLDQFGTEVFHMGSDEVNVACWNATENLTNWMVNEKGWSLNSTDFLDKVWAYFQSEAAKRLYKKAGKEIPTIVYSSDLTALENVTNILPPTNYIIQFWTTSEELISTLLDQNYSIILSNYDNLYLDCGFESWVGTGNNWCSPYKGWQNIYDNNPANYAGNKTSQVLGGETSLWTEQSGTSTVDSRLWPRSAAYAETLWTSPSTTWEEAEERMLIHKERLISLGIQAETMQPEWCMRYQQTCPTAGIFNQ